MRRKYSISVFACLLLPGALALAGDAPARDASPRRVAPPTRIPDPIVSTAPAVTAVPIADVPRAVRHAVVVDAAQRFNVAESAVVVAQAEQVNWPDGALGCPEPRRFYTQMVVPGYRIVAKTSAGEMLYHTDTRGQLRVCGAVSPPRTDSIYKRMHDPALPDSVVDKVRDAVQPRTQPPAKTLPER